MRTKAALIALAIASTNTLAQVILHDGGAGDHLSVGYYFGHNDSFDAPADPPWEPTILVDTHPWELGEIVYEMEEISNSLLNGWHLTTPGFETLRPDEQEFGGHGYYSWLDDSYDLGAPSLFLHVVEIDEGLQALSPFTLEPLPDVSFLGSDFHSHPVFYVDQSVTFEPGDILSATFFISDGSGNLADSAPFTINFTPFLCDADWNNDGAIDSRDVIAFLTDFSAGDDEADINEDGLTDTRDFLDFLNLWTAGC